VVETYFCGSSVGRFVVCFTAIGLQSVSRLYDVPKNTDHMTKMVRLRSALPENPMLHPNITAKFYIAEIGIFDLFRSCDLDPMTFIYELDPKTVEIQRICKYELHTSRLSKVIV